MSNISYIFKRLFSLDYKSLFSTIFSVSKKANQNIFYTIYDIIKCAKLYGAGYNDYSLFEMYKCNDDERNTYLTRKRNEEIDNKFNDYNFAGPFIDKSLFYDTFKDYTNREFVFVSKDNKEKIKKFIIKHDSFMLKGCHGSGGLSVSKIYSKDIKNIDNFIEEILHKDDEYILDELIVQCEGMNDICPDSINTIRVVTLLTTNYQKPYKDLNDEEKKKAKCKVNIFAVICRIGKGGVSVDNFHSGGMAAPVNTETGIIMYPAINRKHELFERHPLTNSLINGYQIPMFKEAISLCKKAALEVKEMGYVGWDVALSNKGPVLVEANNIPGYDLYQLPGQCADHIGMYKKYLDIINNQ